MDGGGGQPNPQRATPSEFWGALKGLLANNRPAEGRAKLVGLIAASPSSEFFKKELEPRWDWFHARSGDRLHFVTLGYGEIANRDSPKVFSIEWQLAAINALEDRCNWKYSGASDLLLFNATYENNGGVRIWLNQGICITLEDAKRDGLFHDFGRLFEELRRHANTYEGDDMLWGFSDRIGRYEAGKALRTLFLSILPKAAETVAIGLQHVAVRKIGRHER